MYQDNLLVFTIPSSVHLFTDGELYTLRQANPDLNIERDEQRNVNIILLHNE
jgi:hypothetical protein